MPMIDYYGILGLKDDASQSQIKTAYRMYCKKYHPDVNSDANAATMFRLINEAYMALTSPQQENTRSDPPQNSNEADESQHTPYEESHDIPNRQLKSPWWLKVIKLLAKPFAIVIYPILWALKIPITIIASAGYILSGLFGLGAVLVVGDIFLKFSSEPLGWSSVVLLVVIAGFLLLVTILSSFLLDLIDIWREGLLDFVVSPL